MEDRIIRRLPGADPAFGMNVALRCAITGHRPHKLFFAADENSAAFADFRARLYEMIRMLVWEGYSHFICGGAAGVDLYAAQIVLEMRRTHPWIGLEVAVPYENQAARWSVTDQQRYASVMRQADIITYVHREYSRDALFDRNRYMVDQADMLLAVYNGRPGGTAMTIEYAKRKNVPVTCMAPVMNQSARALMAVTA